MSAAHFLVVGGTRGIGRALVQRLVADCHAVSVVGREPHSDLAAPNLAQYGVDVTHRAALLLSIDESVARFGKFAHVVFLQRHRSPQAQDDAEFDLDLAVALGATRAAVEHIVARDQFDRVHPCGIVLVGSVADRYVAPEQPLGYHVAKAGLAQLARYYALTLGPAGVRVNVVSPCVVLKPAAKEFYDSNPRLMQRYERFIPLGRMGTPEDIVNSIMFFSSEAASYITGQNLVVDGGFTLRSHESLVRDVSPDRTT